MNATNKKGFRTKVPPITTNDETSGQAKILMDMVLAPSQHIDAMALNLVIRDLDYIIQYIGQRIIIEERYLADLLKLTGDVQAIPNKENAIGLQKCFLNYVDITDQYKPFREQYLKKMKEQLEELKKFRAIKNEQQRMYDKNKYWMHQTNQEYLMNRLKKLPKVQQIYTQKWEEIERSTGLSISTPMIATPNTPSSTFPMLKKELTNEEALSNEANHNNTGENQISPSSPPTQQGRIERFMKKHLNKQEDPTRQNIRIAKLKVEVAEADANYRNVVREITNLAIKMDATNQHILRQVQNSLKEKSSRVKDILKTALEADIEQLQQTQKPLKSMLDLVAATDTQSESEHYASLSLLQKYPKPTPVYYRNYHVDLIFGTTLTEYAQQRGRSPPILITKCIEAIENLGGLEKEGIYRVPGKQSSMEKIKHAFERDEEAVVIGQNDVPEDIFKIPDQELRLMNLLTRLIKLPAANYDTLKALIAHLARIQSRVEKNKMTISNLTLIFTPAIFQDLNHAQSSPGEWAKDCVLEDLILNYNDIFANKDLHNNSAITGDIEYGFSESNSNVDSNRYAIAITSPESPTEVDYALISNGNENSYILSLDDEEDSFEEQHEKAMLVKEEAKLPERKSSIAPEPSMSKPKERRYKAQFQEKGLRLDTSISNKQTIAPSTKSATVPSYDWLKRDPENSPVPSTTKLKRSSTTGKKLSSKRKNYTLDPDAAAAFVQLKASSSTTT
ncbi:hypothetical protein G6F70_002475 [Rhizopus microsporus]|nr:hypothetical protein G6F71_002572 [Rhizopus microsporus]KAG1202168.1 hypothetical protein G6F70_002475 [Rhizopus microsporus]KAG1216238.1 hypothetical protein G6F69_000293 [Rhizopus microsporus]KAG1268154.1 hypothetical protein G6F68_001327 [Rhizopus microsporus]